MWFQSGADVDGGVWHVERDKDFFADKIGVGFSGDAGDDVVENAVPEVCVAVGFARRGDQVCVTADGFVHGWANVWLVLKKEVIV